MPVVVMPLVAYWYSVNAKAIANARKTIPTNSQIPPNSSQKDLLASRKNDG
jgi:hypothetical protein